MSNTIPVVFSVNQADSGKFFLTITEISFRRKEIMKQRTVYVLVLMFILWSLTALAASPVLMTDIQYCRLLISSRRLFHLANLSNHVSLSR